MTSKFKGYIVFDLELTCWDVRNPNYTATEEEKLKQQKEMEIIEIGAVKTDVDFNAIESFTIFCKPVLNPILSDYCTSLTSITQTDVDSAYNFPYAYKKFASWSHKFENRRQLPIAYIGWGNGDGPMLMNTCKVHGLGCVVNNGNYINAKEISKLWIGRGAKGLRKEVERAGLEFIGRQHRGIDDSINTAAVLKFYKKGVDL